MIELNRLVLENLLLKTESIFLLVHQKKQSIAYQSPFLHKIWKDPLDDSLKNFVQKFNPESQSIFWEVLPKVSAESCSIDIFFQNRHLECQLSEVSYQNEVHILLIFAEKQPFSLQEYEEYLFLKTIMDYLPDLVLRIDKNGNYLDVKIGINHNFYKSSREIIGKNIRDISSAENTEVSLQKIGESIEKNKMVEFEYSSTETGRLQHYKANVIPYKASEVGVIVQNQTREVEILQRLKASERKFQAIFENSQDAIFLVSCQDLSIISSNSKAVQFFDVQTKDDFIQKNILSFHQHLDHQEQDFLQKQLLDKQQFVKEYSYHKKEHDLWGNFSANPIEINENSFQLIRIADITEAKKLEIKLSDSQKALSESSDRFRLALESANMGTWDINLENNEMFWDEKTYEIFEATPQDGTPRQIYDQKTHREDWIKTRRETDKQVKEAGILFNFELRVWQKDHSLRYVRVSAKIYRNQNGYAERIIGLCWDITHQKLNEIQLIAAKEEALDLAKTKSQFLSVMTHEIRNSLNAMIGITQILLREKSLPVQVKPLEALKFSADHLLLLINDILDFNKIEANRVIIEQTDFNIYELLRGIEQVFSFLANQKNIGLNVHFDPQIPHWLIGDPAKMSQIITNLVGNAIKFTPKGHISISAIFKEQDEEHIELTLAVSDTGIGIAEDKQDMIFEKFTQAETDTSRRFGGTGLGLAITKRLVALFDSEIKVSSQIGMGAKFYFDLKLKKSQKAFFEVKELELDDAPKDLHKARILIAEDNHVNQLVIIQFLNRWNTLLDVVENGKLALEKAQQSQYDLVLLDLQMPIMNGFQAAKAIRQISEHYRNLPILALSAENFEEIEDLLDAHQISDVIPKPFTSKQLYEKLHEYIGLKQTHIPETVLNFDINPSINLDNVRKIANSDDILQHFIELNQKAFAEYNQFFEKSLMEGDWEEMRRITHKITSTIKFLCVDELLEIVMRGREMVKNEIQDSNEKMMLVQKSRQLSQWILEQLESLKTS